VIIAARTFSGRVFQTLTSLSISLKIGVGSVLFSVSAFSVFLQVQLSQGFTFSERRFPKPKAAGSNPAGRSKE
jgi:hypothetical protein